MSLEINGFSAPYSAPEDTFRRLDPRSFEYFRTIETGRRSITGAKHRASPTLRQN
jgi:hypothetical protein